MTDIGSSDGQHARSYAMTVMAELDKLFQPAQAGSGSGKRARSASSSKDTSVSTPALMSVLPPSRKRQRMTWLAEEQLRQVRTSKPVYRPLSQEHLLERIATFTLTLWNDRKPRGCSAVDFAKRGWRCTGKRREEVACEVCQVTWQVTAVGESSTGQKEALEQDIVTKHSKTCPWRTKTCPSRLSLPLNSRTVS